LHKLFYIKYLLFTFLTILTVSSINLFAQADSIIIEHISTEEGLSYRQVHCVMVDSYGFLWVGTNDGLNRYDGYEFVVYSNDPWDTTSLSSPIITLLTEDEEGNIWVGTPDGLNLYQRHSDSFIRYTHDPKNEYSISENNNIKALLIDHNNSNYIWFGTDGGGLNLLDIELQRFYTLKHNPGNNNSLSGDKVASLFQDSFDEFWIGTSDAGLNRINLNSIPVTSDGKYDVDKFNSIVFEQYLNDGKERGGSHSASVYNIYEDRTGTLWVLLSDSRVLIFNRETNKLIPSPYLNSFFTEHKDIHFHEMLEDHKGILWFGAHNKVFQLNRNTNKIKEYTLNKEDTRSSSNQGLCEDNAGNIWDATWDGIVKIHRDTPLFEHHYHKGDDSSSLSSNKVYSILADHTGKVWIGTDKGLSVMVKDKNGSKSFINYSKLHQNNPGRVSSIFAGRVSSIFAGRVSSIFEDHNGSIWAAAEYTLIRIDPRTNSIIQYKNDPENPNSLSFQKKQNNWGAVNLLLDDTNNLWISAYGGGISKASLEELYSTNDLRDVEFINYFNNPDDPFNSINHFIQDKYGFFWICTETVGMVMFDPKSNIIKNYKQEHNNPKSLSINNANTVHEDKKGNIWIGTEGGGLNEFDRDTESFTHFGIKDGLPSGIIKGILEDDNGNLWISTNRGITKFNPENKKFRNYDVQENEFYSPYFLDTLTGKMYFGGRLGFNVFHPNSIEESSYVPPVVLTKFTRYSDENLGEQISDRSILAKKNIELSYKDDIISFEFAALSFDQNLKCEYAYKLEGFNNNWIDVGTKREVTFTNLDPGNYNFKVKACNQDGIWCDNFASIQIYISPPWWSTWWSYSIYAFCFVGLLGGLRRMDLNRRKEKEDRRLLELENERKTKELEQARHCSFQCFLKKYPVYQTWILLFI